MTSLHMLKPSASQQDVEDAIVQAVSDAGFQPLSAGGGGRGPGGAMGAVRPAGQAGPAAALDQHNTPFYAEMEARLLERINRLGIGPQGLGGTVTALAVSILPLRHHIAQLPVCVNLCCHVPPRQRHPVTGQQGTFVSQVFMNHKKRAVHHIQHAFLSFSESIRPTGRLPWQFFELNHKRVAIGGSLIILLRHYKDVVVVAGGNA